jgi:DNA polymerase-3 subunit epsilon
MMTALAKFKVKTWPYKGAVALIERDEFGTREDFHLVDRWRYLDTVHNEQALYERLEGRTEAAFDPDIYRIMNKYLQTGKLRVLALPALL